jgi:ATP-dependent DNA helicase RecG
MTTAQRRQALLDIASGEAGIVIGTHALIEDRVTFADLALVVIDEQHRFGVEQRAALAAKAPDGTRPHVLVMTATPIPRTIAMTVFGDLDVSTLTEIPAGRKEITTHVVAELEKPAHVTRAWERIREEVSQGRQAYVVCPRIGDEPVEGASVMETLSELTHILSGLHVAALHGRMPSDEKDRVMQQFVDGAIDVLVATSVIEVGVDVPNASVMVVLDAERFGVSQVHQLRGRIGRGEHASLCLLITKAPLGSPGRIRLEAIASTTDGFALSRLDLEQRREGDVLGAVQSGRRSTLRLLEVVRDEDIVAAAREDAIVLIDEDPDLLSLPGLRRAVTALSDEDSTDFLQKA